MCIYIYMYIYIYMHTYIHTFFDSVALVRLIYLGFFEKIAPPHLYTFLYIFAYFSYFLCIFDDINWYLISGGRRRRPPPITISILYQKIQNMQKYNTNQMTHTKIQQNQMTHYICWRLEDLRPIWRLRTTCSTEFSSEGTLQTRCAFPGSACVSCLYPWVRCPRGTRLQEGHPHLGGRACPSRWVLIWGPRTWIFFIDFCDL